MRPGESAQKKVICIPFYHDGLFLDYQDIIMIHNDQVKRKA